MGKPKDITGLKFGKLKAIKLDHIVKKKNGTCHYWLCKCDCGNEKVVNKQCLMNGRIKSCGCSAHPEVYNYDDIIGKKFGRLTVIKYSHRVKKNDNRHYNVYYECLCDCGNTKLVTRSSLIQSHTLSCGCLHKEKFNTYKHGLAYHRLHRIWDRIKQRCLNPNSQRYNDYGGRGIIMCAEWGKDFKTFYDWSMANGYKDDLTIDRINNNGNYEPSNCRWANIKVQSTNTRRNHKLTYKGKTLCISEWANIVGIDKDTLWMRIKRGWSVERAISTPVKTNQK